MKTILCYGDSNTWGYIPGLAGRYKYHQRWPNIFQAKLSKEVQVITEALNGRTTVLDEPEREGRNGKTMLLPLIESHMPLDLIIIMLGTNDLKAIYNRTPEDVAKGVLTLVKIIRKYHNVTFSAQPEILIISPPHVTQLSPLMAMQFESASEKSKQLAVHLQKVAVKNCCLFLDAASIVIPSNKDGVHIDADSHLKLAELVYSLINSKLSQLS